MTSQATNTVAASGPTARQSPWRPLLWLALVLSGYLPLLIRFAREQWGRPQYQFFPLMIVAAIALFWTRLRDSTDSEAWKPGGLAVTRILIGLAFALLLAATVLWTGRLAAVSAWVLLAGAAWQVGGWRMLKLAMPSLVLLALIIGPPLALDEPLLQRLREAAVHVSSMVLIWMGVIHLANGTIIEIPEARLLVAEACSGINSVMAVLGFTLFIGFWRRRSWPMIVGLLFAGIIFVLWANVFRIAGGVWLKSARGVDILSGTAHEWASIVLFSICMGLLFSAEYLVQLVTMLWRKYRGWRHRAQGEDLAEPHPHTAWTLVLPRGMWIWAAVLPLLGCIQVLYASQRGGFRNGISEPGASHLRADALFDMPQQIGPWHRAGDVEKLITRPETEGLKSTAWAYANGPVNVIIAVDYPFRGHHDLGLCYRNAGWLIAPMTKLSEPAAPDTSTYLHAPMDRAEEVGYVWFSSLDETGAWVDVPKPTMFDRLKDRLGHLQLLEWNAATYEVQAWVQRAEPISAQQQAQIEQLFLQCRELIRQQVLSQLEGR